MDTKAEPVRMEVCNGGTTRRKGKADRGNTTGRWQAKACMCVRGNQVQAHTNVTRHKGNRQGRLGTGVRAGMGNGGVA